MPVRTDGEPYRPGLVDIVLDNPAVALRQVGNDDPVVKWAPTASDLFGLNQGFYVDFPGSALSPGCTYERDFWKYTGDQPAVNETGDVVAVFNGELYDFRERRREL